MTYRRGDVINSRYHVIAVLGKGGMGEVYRATDLKTNRDVAVKMIRFQSNDEVEDPESTQSGPEKSAEENLLGSEMRQRQKTTSERNQLVNEKIRDANTAFHAQNPDGDDPFSERPQSGGIPDNFRDAAVAQFKNEAKILNRLIHRSLPKVYDFGQVDGNYFLVMDYIDGMNLMKIVAERKRNGYEVSVGEVMDWARQLLDVVSYCHEHNVTHRDIKPENIILAKNGRIYLVDFGIAKLTDLGRFSILRGQSKQFCSPEQILNARVIDHRSDIYSIAATLYYLLTGEFPASAEDRVLNDFPLMRPFNMNSSIPQWVSYAIEQAMAEKPEERFEGVRQFERALFPAHWGKYLTYAGIVLAPLAAVLVILSLIYLFNKPQPPSVLAPTSPTLQATILNPLPTSTLALPTVTPVAAVQPTPTRALAPTSTPVPTVTTAPAAPGPQVAPANLTNLLVRLQWANMAEVAINPQKNIEDPGQHEYDLRFARSRSVLWGYLWCARTQEQLEASWSKMDMRFYQRVGVDLVEVPAEDFVTLTYHRITPWYCRVRYQLLRSWTPGDYYYQADVNFTETLTDGVENYPPGERSYIYRVNVAKEYQPAHRWEIELKNVNDYARVYVNDVELINFDTVFTQMNTTGRVDISDWIDPGANTLKIDYYNHSDFNNPGWIYEMFLYRDGVVVDYDSKNGTDGTNGIISTFIRTINN